jgi:hypothetical protein
MSTNNAKLLLEQAIHDKELFALLSETETVRLSQFAARAGYPCTLNEIKAALEELREQHTLCSEELEPVSGGKIQQSDVPDTMLALLSSLKVGSAPSQL